MIRISQDGRKLVCLYDTIAEYCNFNPENGQITPLFLFWNDDPYSPFSDFATAEFSVESKFLYINNSYGALGEPSPIRQYDAQKTDSLEFV
jgi:hypothetical protein